MANTKSCSDCGKQLEATLENFHKQSRAKDGLLDRCKSCQNKRTAEYRVGKGKNYWYNQYNESEGYFFKNRKQWQEYLNNWCRKNYRAKYPCTIYKITNKITEEVYVGLTQLPIGLRYSQHKNGLNGKIHGAPLLLKSFRDWGVLNHNIEPIEELDTTDRKIGEEREEHWIKYYAQLGKSLNSNKTK
jgi:hypothetical protein